MTGDADLLCKYAGDRSETAFAELVRRHVDFVYSAALRQVGNDHHRAQDVTQMVFINLARKASALVRHPVLPAWLYRAVYLEAASTRRRDWRRQKYERVAGAEAGITGSDGNVLDWERVWPVLDTAMNELSEIDRRAVLMRYFSNCPFAELGRQLGLTENAARMRVERALAKLHELLARRGIGSSSAALAATLASKAIASAPAGVATAATAAALAGAGGGTAAWMGLMASTKLPVILTTGLILGGAGAGVWQVRADRSMAEELADLSRQNRAIPSLRSENQRLAASVEEARGLRDDGANLVALQEQVRAAEARVAAQIREASAAAQARRLAASRSASGRALPLGDAGPAYDVSRLDQLPSLVTQARPSYPPQLRRSGAMGQVVVDFVVGADGSVYNAFAASSTSPDFEASAVQAVSQWTFNPGQKGGQSVNTHMQVPIIFTLSPPSTVDSPF